jgi:hypothetical protein
MAFCCLSLCQPPLMHGYGRRRVDYCMMSRVLNCAVFVYILFYLLSSPHMRRWAIGGDGRGSAGVVHSQRCKTAITPTGSGANSFSMANIGRQSASRAPAVCHSVNRASDGLQRLSTGVHCSQTGRSGSLGTVYCSLGEGRRCLWE